MESGINVPEMHTVRVSSLFCLQHRAGHIQARQGLSIRGIDPNVNARPSRTIHSSQRISNNSRFSNTYKLRLCGRTSELADRRHA